MDAFAVACPNNLLACPKALQAGKIRSEAHPGGAEARPDALLAFGIGNLGLSVSQENAGANAVDIDDCATESSMTCEH